MNTEKKNRRVGFMAFSAALAMLGLGYASVPLYRLFCQATGFGGTPQIASEAQAATIDAVDQTVSIRFDSNIDSNMPWKFEPETTTKTVKLGERYMAFFVAKNNSDQPVTGPMTRMLSPGR